MYTNVEINKLISRFTYDRDSGKLFWNKRPLEDFQSSASCTTWHKRFEGKEAGTNHIAKSSKAIYRITKVDGKMILVHRIVWAMEYGEWPDNTIDHKDQNGLNNRLDNLRLADDFEQAWNKPINSKNKSGVTGVHAKNGKWTARIGFDNKEMYLGLFDTKEEATEARRLAEALYWRKDAKTDI